MCGWYCYVNGKFKWCNGMVVDRSGWVYIYFAESYCYTYYYRYLFVNGQQNRFGL